MVLGAGKATREEQDRAAPAGVEAAEQGLPHEVGQAVPAVAMGVPTSYVAFADRSSRRRCIRTPLAGKGSKGQWSFASGLPRMDRSRPWRSSALLDSESWTRPRSRRSAAPPRIPSSGAGSGCPSPIVWISSLHDHVLTRQLGLRSLDALPPYAASSGPNKNRCSRTRARTGTPSRWSGSTLSRGAIVGARMTKQAARKDWNGPKSPCSLVLPCL